MKRFIAILALLPCLAIGQGGLPISLREIRLVLEWDAPTEPVSFYKVYYQPKGGREGEYSILKVDAPATTGTITVPVAQSTSIFVTAVLVLGGFELEGEPSNEYVWSGVPKLGPVRIKRIEAQIEADFLDGEAE